MPPHKSLKRNLPKRHVTDLKAWKRRLKTLLKEQDKVLAEEARRYGIDVLSLHSRCKIYIEYIDNAKEE